jgi:AcrR family transcriptional regulator
MTLSDLTRRERKKEETRRRIFETAIALFREKGFEQTTVDEITEKADVGRGTFFNYFPRKESVLAYLSEERVALAEENAAVLLEDRASANDKLLDIYSFAASAYLRTASCRATSSTSGCSGRSSPPRRPGSAGTSWSWP